MSEAVFRRLDVPRAVRALREWVRRDVATRDGVVRVVLVGSLARGDWSARSDADLVVVVEHSREAPRDRAVEFMPSRWLGVPVDVVVFTLDEAAAWRPRYRDAVAGGVVLFERVAS